MVIAVKERPIIFSTEMVKAILEGRKTQTRRVIKPQPPSIKELRNIWGCLAKETDDYIKQILDNSLLPKCPYGQAGDRLWVRESHHLHDELRESTEDDLFTWIAYKADSECRLINRQSGVLEEEDILAADSERNLKWRPSIHMPRWASRITLEITGVRVERLQEITREDSIDEGYPKSWCYMNGGDETDWFAYIWDSLNAKRGYGWETNPWVWVIEFKKTRVI